MSTPSEQSGRAARQLRIAANVFLPLGVVLIALGVFLAAQGTLSWVVVLLLGAVFVFQSVMFRRSLRRLGSASAEPAPARPPAVAVGARVVVRAGGPRTPIDLQWRDEPSGVVIAPGNNEMVGYPGLAPGGPPNWLVAFDEPAFRVDGSGPYDQANIDTRLLLALPPESQAPDAREEPDRG